MYLNGLDKVLFVLSYMNKGDAASWKEEFFDSAEASTGRQLDLETYKNLINLIMKDFSPYNAPKDIIYEMKEMKMGDLAIKEHVTKFKMLVTKSKLTKNKVVVGYFCEPSWSPFRDQSCLF